MTPAQLARAPAAQSALARAAHEYAKWRAVCRREWVPSIASIREMNGALMRLGEAAEAYARECAEVFKVEVGP